MNSEEHKLKTRIASGDNFAFRRLFDLYYLRVCHFVCALVKNMDASEDIAQELFIKLWNSRTKLGQVKSLNAWIYTIARNASLNYLRDEIRSVSFSDVTTPSAYNSEEEYLCKERELQIRLIVNNMPNQRQKIFRMSRYQGKSNDEIAKELNIAKKTVENHMNLALNEIRKKLI